MKNKLWLLLLLITTPAYAVEQFFPDFLRPVIMVVRYDDAVTLSGGINAATGAFSSSVQTPEITSTGDLRIMINNTELIRMLANGDIGFGTSTPIDPFHFYQAADPNMMKLETGDGNGAVITYKSTDHEYWAGIDSAGDWSIHDLTNGKTRFTVDTAGSVGIGTETISIATPGLEVAGGIHADGAITSNSVSTEKIDLGAVSLSILRQGVRKMRPKRFQRKIPQQYRRAKTVIDFDDRYEDRVSTTTYGVDTNGIPIVIDHTMGAVLVESATQQLAEYNARRAQLQVDINYTTSRLGIYLDDANTPEIIKAYKPNGQPLLDHGMSINYLLAIVSDQQKQIDSLLARVQILEARP